MLHTHAHPYTHTQFNMNKYTGRPSGPLRQAYGHVGATYGYDSLLIYFPAIQLAMAVATNIETDTQGAPAEVCVRVCVRGHVCVRVCVCKGVHV